jgi:hypothetical protein
VAQRFTAAATALPLGGAAVYRCGNYLAFGWRSGLPLRQLPCLWVAQRFTAAVTALPLGGAAVHRCGNCLVLNSALAAEGAALDQELLFPQVV